MSNVLIIGGGFAGAWAAAGIKRQARTSGLGEADLRVTLVDASDDLVIRPRLYERDPHAYRVSLDRVLGPIGVRRIAGIATTIDSGAKQVTVIERDGSPVVLGYDKLVLAAGSRGVRPTLPGAEHLFDVDQLVSAARLQDHLRRLPTHPDGEGRYTAVVIGAGFTGIEVACEVADRLCELTGAPGVGRVVLVEREEVVGPELGPGPRPEINAALDALGVERRLGTEVSEVLDGGVRLSDGTTIPADTVIWTAGMLANPLTRQIPGERDRLGRLVVDEYLRVVGVPDVYAAGDTAAAVAEPGHPVMQSCQHAVPQGKFVGQNVAADLLGLEPVVFAPDPYVTCLDLGSYGAVLTLGWDRTVQLTKQDAKDLKRNINTSWIYPPVDDATTILDYADWRTTWPTAAL
jgi:NADH:ubiquinone reductase (H+-translocating)